MKKLILLFSTALMLTACNFGGASPAAEPTSGPTSGTATGAQATAVPRTSTPTATNAPTATPTVPPTTAAPAITATGAPPTMAGTAVVQIPANCTQGTGKVITLASELKIEDLLLCDGAEARNGMTIAINYVGTLRDGGAKFDSSYDRGQPSTFVLGTGPLEGWNEEIVGMKVGSKRRLTIPPGLAYGNQAHGSIPPNSTLVYDIDLVSAK